ncbi:hypothetical protein L7F22_059431 [Adiantum nelumboides]|nr:hypothetical protein [Adiantum nelumboides]
MDLAKIKAIQDWSEPVNLHEVRNFLGLCSYYRRFICFFPEIAAPLHDLTREGGVFNFGERQQQAFMLLKEKLNTKPVLILPDLRKSFQVQCDACGSSIGAVLMQDGHVIAYESRVLRGPEKHMQVYEELLAVIHALESWKHYLLGADFTVQTDHQSLRYFLTQAKLSEKHLSWVNFLSMFHFQLVHVAGKKNVVADALSRRPHVAAVSVAYQHELDDMRDHYSTDEDFAESYDALVRGEHSDSDSSSGLVSNYNWSEKLVRDNSSGFVSVSRVLVLSGWLAGFWFYRVSIQVTGLVQQSRLLSQEASGFWTMTDRDRGLVQQSRLLSQEVSGFWTVTEGDLENKMGEPSSSCQNFNFRDDEGSAQGMQALRLLLAKLQEAQANPRLKPSVNNLLMTEDLMLTSTQRLSSSVAPMHLEGGEGVPVMHGPMQANVVPHPLQGPLQTDGAKKKQYHGQERHVGKIREEGDFHDDDDEPPSRSRHKKRTNERRTKRSRRNSSGGSSSSSQSGRSSHGRFPKKAMANSQDSSLYNIKKLDGTNFPLWKKKIWHGLVQKKQLKPIKLKGIKPKDMDEDKWNEMDELALSTHHVNIGKKRLLQCSRQGIGL